MSNLMNAQDAHSISKVMNTKFQESSFYYCIRDRALHGGYDYVTHNISPELISELRALGYTVTEGLGDIRWVVIEW